MPSVEFEAMTPVFQRVKPVHALDRAAWVTGKLDQNKSKLKCLITMKLSIYG
jgi:hypothetical protein